LAARKTTTKKSTKSAPKGKRAAQPQPEELGPILSRPVWGAIWGIVGLLCLLSILPIDGVLLKWLHRGIGALIGKGAYVMPFALIGIAVLLFARPKGPVRLRGTCIALMPLLIGSIIHAFSCANEYDLSMSTLSGLLSTGMEGSSGGLLGGGLHPARVGALVHRRTAHPAGAVHRDFTGGLSHHAAGAVRHGSSA